MPIYPTGKKKNGLQQYRVRINYTEGGLHQQKEKTCYGYRAAVEMERRLLNLYSVSGSRSQILLRDYYAEYMQLRRKQLRETTFVKLKSNIELHILPTLGDYSVCDIDPTVITRWQAALLEKSFSIVYCRRIYGSLCLLLNSAYKRGIIPENPTKKVENFRDPNFVAPDVKFHFYTPEQFLAYAEAAQMLIETYLDYSLYVFFMIAYYTGLRKGEIHALRWSDLDGNVLKVRRSITQKIKGKQIVETPPKSKASVRDIQIPTVLSAILENNRALQQERFPGWTPQYRIVRGDQCLSDTFIDLGNREIAEAAGLDRIRIHDFRHSHASLLANSGINIQEVARRLGHGNVQITWDTYAHLYPKESERAVSVLDTVIIPEFSPLFLAKE